MLEFFGAFCRTALELYEFEKKVAAIGLEADMLERRDASVHAAEGDGCAGEIECEARRIDDDFDSIGIVEGFGFGSMDDGRHLLTFIAHQ